MPALGSIQQIESKDTRRKNSGKAHQFADAEVEKVHGLLQYSHADKRSEDGVLDRRGG